MDFAMLPGMNRFAAVTILSRISGTEFLSLSPNLRSTHFGSLVGQERIVSTIPSFLRMPAGRQG